MNVQKMKLKKQEHATYRIVKKQEKTSHLHEKLLGQQGNLEGSEAYRATVSKSEAQPGFLAFCFHPIRLKILSSQQIVDALWSCPINPLSENCERYRKEAPPRELRTSLKQMENHNRRQSLNKHYLWINRKAQLHCQVLPSTSRLGSPSREVIIVKQILLLILKSGSWRVVAMKICKCFHWNAQCIINQAQQALQINNTL